MEGMILMFTFEPKWMARGFDCCLEVWVEARAEDVGEVMSPKVARSVEEAESSSCSDKEEAKEVRAVEDDVMSSCWSGKLFISRPFFL